MQLEIFYIILTKKHEVFITEIITQRLIFENSQKKTVN